MIYIELLIGFLKVGLFSFGGAYAAIPLIRDVVLSYGWIDEEKLSYMIGVSESTPGPIMVNIATYVGTEQGGVLGAVVATLAVILPAFVIILLIMAAFKGLIKNERFKAVIDGIKPCVIGIILATGAYMILSNCFQLSGKVSADWRALTITLALVMYEFFIRIKFKKKSSPLVLISVSAAMGIVLYGI